MPNINFKNPQFKNQNLNDIIINLSTLIMRDDFNKNIFAYKLKSLYKQLREVDLEHVVTDFSDYLKFLIAEMSGHFFNDPKRKNIFIDVVSVITAFDGLFASGIDGNVLIAICHDFISEKLFTQVLAKAELVKDKYNAEYITFMQLANDLASDVQALADVLSKINTLDQAIKAVSHNPSTAYIENVTEVSKNNAAILPAVKAQVLNRPSTIFSMEDNNFPFIPEENRALFQELQLLIESVRYDGHQDEFQSILNQELQANIDRLNSIANFSDTPIDTLHFLNEPEKVLEKLKILLEQNKNETAHHIYSKLSMSALLRNGFYINLDEEFTHALQAAHSHVRTIFKDGEADKVFSIILQYQIFLLSDAYYKADIFKKHIIERLIERLLNHPLLFWNGENRITVYVNHYKETLLNALLVKSLPDRLINILLEKILTAYERTNDNNSVLKLFLMRNIKEYSPLKFSAQSLSVDNFRRYLTFVEIAMQDPSTFKQLIMLSALPSSNTLLHNIVGREVEGKIQLLQVFFGKLEELQATRDEIIALLNDLGRSKLSVLLTLILHTEDKDVKAVEVFLDFVAAKLGATSSDFKKIIDHKGGDFNSTALMFAANNDKPKIARLIKEKYQASIFPHDWFRKTVTKMENEPSKWSFLTELLVKRSIDLKKQNYQVIIPSYFGNGTLSIDFRNNPYTNTKKVISTINRVIRATMSEDNASKALRHLDRNLSDLYDELTQINSNSANQHFSAYLQNLIYYVTHQRNGLQETKNDSLLEYLCNHKDLFYIHEGHPTVGVDLQESAHYIVNISRWPMPPHLYEQFLQRAKYEFEKCKYPEGFVNLLCANEIHGHTAMSYAARQSTLNNLTILIKYLKEALGEKFKSYLLEYGSFAFNVTGDARMEGNEKMRFLLALARDEKFTRDEMQQFITCPDQIRRNYTILDKVKWHVNCEAASLLRELADEYGIQIEKTALGDSLQFNHNSIDARRRVGFYPKTIPQHKSSTPMMVCDSQNINEKRPLDGNDNQDTSNKLMKRY